MSNLNFPYCSFISFPRVLLLTTRKRWSASYPPLPSLRKLYTATRSPLSLLFSKLDKPSDFSRSVSYPWDLSPSWSPFSGHTLIVWCPSYTEAPKTAHSAWGGASPVHCRLGQWPPSISYLCYASSIPGHSRPFWLKGTLLTHI